MTVWQPTNPIDYSPNGDDIDALAQKTLGTFDEIYALLQRLRTGNAGSGTSVSDAEPFEIRIDSSTEPATICMKVGNQWKELGKAADNFGFDANSFNGVKNGGGIAGIGLGLDAQKPENAPNDTVYVAYDTRKIYVKRSGVWDLLLSNDFDDITDAEDTLVYKSEVSESPTGGEIPRVNSSTGLLDVNISGNAAKLLNYLIRVTDLQNGDVLAFDTTNQRLVNVRKDEVKNRDVSTTGEANKIVKTDSQGKAHVDITGSPDKIAGKTIDVVSLQDGNALVYSAATQHFENRPVAVKDANGDLDANIKGSAAKIGVYPMELENLADGHAMVYDATNQKFKNKAVATKDSQGVVDANISGSAAKLVNVPVRLDGNLQDGQVFVYHAALGCFINEAKGTVGSGASLSIHQGTETTDYNGSQNVEVTIPTTTQVQYQIEHTLATDDAVGVMKLYDTTGDNTDGAVTQGLVSHAVDVGKVMDVESLTIPIAYQGQPIYTCWTAGNKSNKYVVSKDLYSIGAKVLVRFANSNSAQNMALAWGPQPTSLHSLLGDERITPQKVYEMEFVSTGTQIVNSFDYVDISVPEEYANLLYIESPYGSEESYNRIFVPYGFDLSNGFLVHFSDLTYYVSGNNGSNVSLYTLDDNGNKAAYPNITSGRICSSDEDALQFKAATLSTSNVYLLKWRTVPETNNRYWHIEDYFPYARLPEKVLYAKAVTQHTTDDSNAIATTAFVKAAIAAALANNS